MRIEVKHESCKSPHPVNITQDRLEKMVETGKLSFTEILRTGNRKTISITGSNREKLLLAQALLKSMDV